MATLEQVGEIVTAQLRERVDRLVSAIDDGGADFGEIASLADAVREFADGTGRIYSEIERTLVEGLQDAPAAATPPPRSEHQKPAEEPEAAERGQSSANGSSVKDATKEELLEQAREANIHGRSSMSKDELEQAVEAEEHLTKDELLERAREAGIEGRSSMTKDELRTAVRNAGA